MDAAALDRLLEVCAKHRVSYLKLDNQQTGTVELRIGAAALPAATAPEKQAISDADIARDGPTTVEELRRLALPEDQKAS